MEIHLPPADNEKSFYRLEVDSYRKSFYFSFGPNSAGKVKPDASAEVQVIITLHIIMVHILKWNFLCYPMNAGRYCLFITNYSKNTNRELLKNSLKTASLYPIILTNRAMEFFQILGKFTSNFTIRIHKIRYPNPCMESIIFYTKIESIFNSFENKTTRNH